MLQFLSSHLVAIIAGVAGGACIFALRIFLKRRKERAVQKEMTLLQRRNDALNQTLSNPKVKQAGAAMAGPMEVQWDERALDSRRSGGSSVMVELVEFSTYSRRKYLFPLGDTISIGSGVDNHLVLQRERVQPKHCEIFLSGNAVAVRSVAESEVLLIRGKKSALISGEGVFLNNGDRIRIGTANIQYRCFEA